MMNMQKMMRQVQKMQAQVEQVQEELGEKSVEGTAGGGVVRAIVNGHQQVIAVHIEPEAVDPEDVEMLQDLVMSAVNEGLRLAQELAESEIAKVTGNMNIPGLPGGLF